MCEAWPKYTARPADDRRRDRAQRIGPEIVQIGGPPWHKALMEFIRRGIQHRDRDADECRGTRDRPRKSTGSGSHEKRSQEPVAEKVRDLVGDCARKRRHSQR